MAVSKQLLGLSIKFQQRCRFYSTSFLNENQIALQRLCRDFSNKELKPVAGELDKHGRYPYDIIQKIAGLGLMGMGADSKYGGSNLDTLSTSVIVEELCRGCASTGIIVSIHNCLYVNLLSKRGTDAQNIKFLAPYTAGEIGAFALTEPGAGSDVSALATTATKDGDSWILNGTKSWVTSGIEATSAIVFATVDKSKKHKGITGFIVPLNSPGVSRGAKEHKMGIKATSTCDIILNNVKISEENLLGEIGQGFQIAMDQLDQARIGVASQALGISQAAFDTAMRYATERIQFNKPILAISTVKHRLAEMAVRIEAARLLTRQAAVLYDLPERSTKWSSMAKIAASECAVAVTNSCVQILGGMGYVEDYPAERYYRDAKITEIIGGVTDVHKLIVSEELMKECGIKF